MISGGTRACLILERRVRTRCAALTREPGVHPHRRNELSRTKQTLQLTSEKQQLSRQLLQRRGEAECESWRRRRLLCACVRLRVCVEERVPCIRDHLPCNIPTYIIPMRISKYIYFKKLTFLSPCCVAFRSRPPSRCWWFLSGSCCRTSPPPSSAHTGQSHQA